MPVPCARFDQLLEDIEPSATTKRHASSGHNDIREHLRKQAKFKDRYEHSFLSGSYVRDTAIRPRTSSDGQERPDVDIIVVTNFTTSDHPDTVLNEVCRAFDAAATRYRPRSIKLFMAAPAALGVTLGHRWNALPATQLHEFLAPERRYVPSAVI